VADALASRVVLHVGTHRTGTTSLQHFLHTQAELLASVGAAYPPGFLFPSVHSELPLLAARAEWLWPARIRLPETRRPAWLAAAAAHVREQLRAPIQPVLVYSHEDLSYLRTDDELERLRDLLAVPSVDVVVCLREPGAFLRSYRDQLTALGFELSDDRDSFAYVGEDSWLVDYEALLGGYRRWFGADRVHVIDFDADADTGAEGSIIPAFGDLLGIPRASLPPLDTYFLNRAGRPVRPSDEQVAAIRRRIVEQAP
jgi:hypothetical protein